jgi:hypothetical protein
MARRLGMRSAKRMKKAVTTRKDMAKLMFSSIGPT